MTDEYSVLEVVDGQQRLTTLIILLKAIQLGLDAKAAGHAKLVNELQDILIKQDELSLILLQIESRPQRLLCRILEAWSGLLT